MPQNVAVPGGLERFDPTITTVPQPGISPLAVQGPDTAAPFGRTGAPNTRGEAARVTVAGEGTGTGQTGEGGQSPALSAIDQLATSYDADKQIRGKRLSGLAEVEYIQLSTDQNQHLFAYLQEIAQRLEQVPFSQRGSFGDKVIEVYGSINGRNEKKFQNDTEVDVALQAMRQYGSRIAKAMALKATLGGTKDAVVDLSDTITRKGFWDRTGLGMWNPAHFIGGAVWPLYEKLGFPHKEKVLRIWSAKESGFRQFEIGVGELDMAIVDKLARDLGVETWSTGKFLQEIDKIADLEAQIAGLLKLRPYENLAQRNLLELSDPGASPSSERGIAWDFENRRRDAFKVLIDQSSVKGKTTEEKWQSLTEEQRWQLWLQSYDVAAIDKFRTLDAKIQRRIDTEQVSSLTGQAGQLEQLGEEMKKGKPRSEDDLKDELKKAQIVLNQKKDITDHLVAAYKQLDRIENGVQNEQGEIVQRSLAQASAHTARMKQRYEDRRADPPHDQEIIDLNKRITELGGKAEKSKEELVELEDKKKQKQDLIDAAADDYQDAVIDQGDLETLKKQLIDQYFSEGTRELNHEEKVNKVTDAQQEYETAEASLNKIRTKQTAPETDKDRVTEGTQIVRVSQIVKERNTIKGNVTQEWTDRVGEAARKGDWDLVQTMLCEFIFEQTGTAQEKLTIGRDLQRQILTKGFIAQVIVETLGLDQKTFLPDSIRRQDSQINSIGQVIGLLEGDSSFDWKTNRAALLKILGYSGDKGPGKELGKSKTINEILKVLKREQARTRDRHSSSLEKSFAQVATMLSENQVQNSRIIGALIDRMYDDAMEGRLTGINPPKPADLAEELSFVTPPAVSPPAARPAAVSRTTIASPTPPTLSPQERTEVRAVKHITAFQGEATFFEPTGFPRFRPMQMQIEATSVSDPHKKIRLTVDVGGTLQANLMLDKFGTGSFVDTKKDTQADWGALYTALNSPDIVSAELSLLVEASVGRSIAHAGEFPAHAVPKDTSFSGKDIDYGARSIHRGGERDEIERSKKIFANFKPVTITDPAFGNITVSFREGRLWASGEDSAVGELWLSDLESRYKKLYLAKKGITDESKLTDPQVQEIKNGILELYTQAGKRALETLHK